MSSSSSCMRGTMHLHRSQIVPHIVLRGAPTIQQNAVGPLPAAQSAPFSPPGCPWYTRTCTLV